MIRSGIWALASIVLTDPAAGQAPAAPVAAASSALPKWLQGCWFRTTGADWVEECWSDDRGGIMLGWSRAGRADTLQFWETMQIELEPGARPTLTFWASPRGAARTRFEGAPDGNGGVIFRNPATDYPQRIRYWRMGDRLMAEIALADGTKAQRWSYRRR